MKRNFLESLQNRRSYYSLTRESTLSDEQIKELIQQTLLCLPSAFNSQTTRIVLLLGEQHTALWEITKESLRKIVPPEAFPKTEQKINTSFAAGYGTILFYEDTARVTAFQKDFPTYSHHFPVWSEHTSAMHQLAIWTQLEDAGMGASLQHYNPVIDTEVARKWNFPAEWKLIAQMPFGKTSAQPGVKEHQPLEERFYVFA